MRIYDTENDVELDRVIIYLNPEEANELASYCEDLSKHPEKHHAHICDNDYTREIIVSVYTAENMNQFDKRSRELIGDDWKRPYRSPKLLRESRTNPIKGAEEKSWLRKLLDKR